MAPQEKEAFFPFLGGEFEKFFGGARFDNWFCKTRFSHFYGVFLVGHWGRGLGAGPQRWAQKEIGISIFFHKFGGGRDPNRNFSLSRGTFFPTPQFDSSFWEWLFGESG